jgi:hypothetical protein
LQGSAPLPPCYTRQVMSHMVLDNPLERKGGGKASLPSSEHGNVDATVTVDRANFPTSTTIITIEGKTTVYHSTNIRKISR